MPGRLICGASHVVFVFIEHRVVYICAVFFSFFEVFTAPVCGCLFFTHTRLLRFFWLLFCLICVGMFATPLRVAQGGCAALRCANIVGAFTF